ncbi:MAG TPA: precorrin-6Y C5,15-methyltransferase (decarboxylating) subunit CbiT [Candidatus Nitrosocosmicus sp.]|nr:precorrin-6Y C5,15-methyltransferase (decarboxylating) subunit CbiT [Candidatus Nitrosocosmicus sp.]
MNKNFLWDYKTSGIPDEYFDRMDKVPITKEEIRSIIISKLRLKEEYISIDVGCGSGSISIEMALQTKATVYAIDMDKNAIDLTSENVEKFGLEKKINIIHGLAQDVLPYLPKVDAIVIGGTTGDTEKIISLAIERLNSGGRLVVTSILFETIYKTLKALEDSQLSQIDISQVTIAKSKKTTSGTMMISRNPVVVFSATK